MSDNLPSTMTGVVLTGHGGFEMLEYRTDLPVPVAGPGEVVVRVGAAGINNTDINTRIAWYSKSVTGGTNIGGEGGFDQADDADGSWAGEALEFPRVQGADGCGVVVAVGEGVDKSRIGERVLIRTIQTSGLEGDYVCRTFGSECDGAFAQYTKTASVDALMIESDLTDAELASFPCAYSTAEGMLERASVGAETVLITGASGGVGSAAVQLAKRRGATVLAIASASKADDVAALGADRVIERGTDLIAELGADSVDVVVDLVAGPDWPPLLDLLTRGGRYVTAGAIAGPIVEFDVRTLYLKDLSFFGCTYQPTGIFENLVSYIERGEIKPVLAETWPLAEIVAAQEAFLSKKHTGKLVLIPPQD